MCDFCSLWWPVDCRSNAQFSYPLRPATLLRNRGWVIETSTLTMRLSLLFTVFSTTSACIGPPTLLVFQNLLRPVSNVIHLIRMLESHHCLFPFTQSLQSFSGASAFSLVGQSQVLTRWLTSFIGPRVRFPLHILEKPLYWRQINFSCITHAWKDRFPQFFDQKRKIFCIGRRQSIFLDLNKY